MKKFLTLILSAILAIFTLFMVACKDTPEGKLSLYAPDGAPALSVARLLDDETIIEDIDISVVSANEITSFVSGEEKKADLCILPVNAASKFLGTADDYKMLGVVTHGNLFLMKKQSGVNITIDNLDVLVGKKVGVLNLANVPGLTFKAILSANDIDFVNYSGEVVETAVNLVGLSKGEEVIPSSDCDYFVVPEPAATTKENKTQGKLSIAGSLQELYGEENGFPQAVLVAKNSVIESHSKTIEKLIEEMSLNATYLKEQTDMNIIVNAVKSGFLDKEMAPTFSADNLNSTVITNCAIRFEKATDAYQKVLDYLTKLNGISNNAFGTPVDAFFYGK